MVVLGEVVIEVVIVGTGDPGRRQDDHNIEFQ